MAHIPQVLDKLIGDIAEKDMREALTQLNITETKEFKNFCAHSVSKSPCRDFMRWVFGANRIVVEALYRKVEMILFLGGCIPAVGIAFNVIDACFCFILGNWLGVLVAILSCFPIPGFKAAGKGLEKFLTAVIKKIPIHEFISRFARMLETRITLSGQILKFKDPYETILNSVMKYVPGYNNPFAESVFKKFFETIEKMSKSHVSFYFDKLS